MGTVSPKLTITARLTAVKATSITRGRTIFGVLLFILLVFLLMVTGGKSEVTEDSVRPGRLELLAGLNFPSVVSFRYQQKPPRCRRDWPAKR